MMYRFIVAIDMQYDSLENAKKDIDRVTELIWDEVCPRIDDPLPKVLDIYEVKE